MSGATDSGMVKIMGVVIGALALLAVIAALAARMMGGEESGADDPMMKNALVERIAPVASVRTSADDLPVAASAPVAVAGSSEPKSAEELANGTCGACHISGVADAPIIGDTAAWATRAEAGLDALVASVMNGKGTMAPRGGSDYSDEEIIRAVQFMAGFEVDEAPAATEEAPTEDAATEEAAEEPAANDEASADDAATEEAASTDTASATADASVVAALVGVEPEGLTDLIKTTVDTSCASCHLAGVADAPKIGDQEAWQERAAKGLDALTASVINGMNVMPPRGASTLTDEQMPVAVQYLMSK